MTKNSNSLQVALVAALRKVLPDRDRNYELHEPRFDDSDRKKLLACLDSTFVSSAGPFIGEFEQDIADYTGIPHACAVNNGTAALHLALIACDISRDEEVLVPSFCFVATANAVAYQHAVPHFVDIEPSTLGIGAASLEAYLKEIADQTGEGCVNRLTGRRIRALIVMHTFGHPADMDGLAELCARRSIILIEDSAEALGSFYKGRHVGHHALVSTLSFNGNKIITTGGGGMVLTANREIHERVQFLSRTAKTPHPWEFEHKVVGYNYRLPNLNASLGCSQMDRLGLLLSSKRALHRAYDEALKGVDGLSHFRPAPGVEWNCWLNAILLDEPEAGLRDDVIRALRAEKFNVRPAWIPLHSLPMYQDHPHMPMTHTNGLFRRVINLPSSAFLHPGAP